MAGDWLKIERALPDKPEVWAIAAALDIDPDAVVGKLLRVWSWFDEQTESGNAPSVTKMLLDRRVGVTGFCDAMIQTGWMGDDAETITLPNFDRHNGKTAKNRAVTAKRVARHKAKSNGHGNGKGNGSSVTDPLPREEKRRISDPTRARTGGAGLAYGDIVSWLTQRGTPWHFCTGDHTRQQILTWVEAGVTEADLATALSRANEHKSDGPIGPSYLDPVVRQVVTERTQPEGNTNGTSRPRHRSQSAVDRSRDGVRRFLEQQQAGHDAE